MAHQKVFEDIINILKTLNFFIHKDQQIPLDWSVNTFAKGFGLGIYQYFLTLFLPGYTRWEFNDFGKLPNGLGISLERSVTVNVRQFVTCLTVNDSATN